jgi:phosphate starvation-inducible PhoH-like protein
MANKRGRKTEEQVTPTKQGRSVQARTLNQQTYLDAIDSSKLIICTGPAGSGKTHLAIGAGVKYLRSNNTHINRIIVSRPMIAAARKDMGAIPGNADEKMAPFLRPLEDELKYYSTVAELEAWKTCDPKKFEIVPLDHMRGRTFNNSFIILDEAQNAEEEQIQMILTRLGHNSKMVISGDLDASQCDLPRRFAGGLSFFADILVRMNDISVVELDETDIQRDPLVSAILKRIKEAKNVEAYQRNQKQEW